MVQESLGRGVHRDTFLDDSVDGWVHQLIDEVFPVGIVNNNKVSNLSYFNRTMAAT